MVGRGHPDRRHARRRPAGSWCWRRAIRSNSISQLEDLLSLPRPISQIAPDPSTLAALPDLPAQTPLLNAVDARLGTESGDNPGFDFFARGGVGDIGEATCKGDGTVGFGRSLRDALHITLPLPPAGRAGGHERRRDPRGPERLAGTIRRLPSAPGLVRGRQFQYIGERPDPGGARRGHLDRVRASRVAPAPRAPRTELNVPRDGIVPIAQGHPSAAPKAGLTRRTRGT